MLRKKSTVPILGVLLAAVLCLGLFGFAGAAEPQKTVRTFFVDPGSGRQSYLEGETFSAEGYTGTVLYTDGSSETLSAAQMTYTVPTPLTQDTTVTFSCALTSITAGLPVTVSRLQALEYAGEYKSEYLAGEEFFDPTGLSFRLKYENGETRDLALSDVRLSEAEDTPISSSAAEVTAEYTLGLHTLTAHIPVTVKAVASLSVKKFPDHTYYEGDGFWFEDGELEISALFAGETEERTVTNYTIGGIESPLRADGNGRAELTFTLDGVTVSRFLEPIPLLRFDVTSSSGMQDIYLDRDNVFFPDFLTVLAVYDNGMARDITAEVEFTYPELFRAGDTVLAEFGGFSIPLDAVVAVHKAELQVIQPPARTTYQEGDTFDLSGFTALIAYDDGRIYNPSVSEFSVTAASPLQVSDAEALVEWNGLSLSVPISVMPRTGMTLNIDTPPEKIRYLSGQPIDLNGLTVSLLIDGQDTPTVLSSGMYVTVPAEGAPAEEGLTEISIRYYLSDTVYFEAVQPVEVEARQARGILISTMPTKTLYQDGDSFNPTGMVLEVFYNDGTSELISRGYSVDVGALIIRDGSDEQTEIPVTVTYNGMHSLLTVLVTQRKIARLQILTQPEKREYEEGEIFSDEGMNVAVFYADSPDVPVILPRDYYTCTPSGKLKASDSLITVSFRGVSAFCDIAVRGEITPPETQPRDPENTTAPQTEPPISTEPNTPVTAAPPPVTQEVQTGAPETTTGTGSGGSAGNGKILVLWIVIIAIIVAALVGLIIYYRRNFT